MNIIKKQNGFSLTVCSNLLGWKACFSASRNFLLTAALLSCSTIAFAETTQTDGEALRQELLEHYPSLAWVERYRQVFPAEVQGNNALWRAPVPPTLSSYADIITALAPLQDQHVALVDLNRGKQETLGILSEQAAMARWWSGVTSIRR